MNPHSILAVTDFSIVGDRALARAALLSAAHGASLKLAYLPPASERPPPDAACRLALHARQLGRRHAIPVGVVGHDLFDVDGVLREAVGSDLIVWGASRAAGLRSLLGGQPLDALLRRGKRPVLVVRRPARRAYEHVLVAVDFTDKSQGLARLSTSFNPSARLELFHAIGTANEGKLRYAEVSERAIRAYRQECWRHAQAHLRTLTELCRAGDGDVRTSIGHGDPARQIHLQQEQVGADLVVVGKHPASRLSDLVFGSVSQGVLRRARSDVLVVPHGFEKASAARLVTRLAQEPAALPRVRAGSMRLPGRGGLPGEAAFLRMPARPSSGSMLTSR